jgi:autotransporter adhesin
VVPVIGTGTAVTGLEPASVGGTRFGGNYTITAIPSGTTATLAPIDDALRHQAPDTGGTGTAISIAFESPTPPQGGQAFDINSTMLLAGPLGFAVDGKFSAAPGAFEVDIQVADIDADANYQTISNGNVTTVDATNNTFHFDCTWVVAKFARVKLLTRTNAVGFVATIRG